MESCREEHFAAWLDRTRESLDVAWAEEAWRERKLRDAVSQLHTHSVAQIRVRVGEAHWRCQSIRVWMRQWHVNARTDVNIRKAST